MPASGPRSAVIRPEWVEGDAGVRPPALNDAADVRAGDDQVAVLLERNVCHVPRLDRPERVEVLSVERPDRNLAGLAGAAVDTDDEMAFDVERESVVKAAGELADDVALSKPGF